MGRGRGRGRKLTNGRNHEDKGSSGEEVVPARKRRGRPQKRIADKVDQADVKKLLAEGDSGGAGFQEMEGDDAKLKESRTEDASAGNGNKRNRAPKEESPDGLDLEENSSSTRSSNDESNARSSGFRQNGSRRKSTPRRAAEAGL